MYTKISWDWKKGPEAKDLRRALKQFGVFVYDDPDCDGTDGVGVIFSNKEMSKAQINETTEIEDDE